MTDPIWLNYAPPPSSAARWVQAVRWLLPITWLLYLLAVALIWLTDVESVIGTGPFIFVGGVCCLLTGLQLKQMDVTLLGAGHVGVCCALFAAVVLLKLSPDDARIPFTMAGSLWLVLTLVPTLLIGRDLCI
jgi:hypothetical protein